MPKIILEFQKSVLISKTFIQKLNLNKFDFDSLFMSYLTLLIFVLNLN